MTGRPVSRRGLLRSALLGGPALALPACAQGDGPHRRLTPATGAPGGPYHAFGHALAAEAARTPPHPFSSLVVGLSPGRKESAM
ncbi:hypothetical protein [Streptomyces bauhiniae]|uniref:hypothetical protein n=1 Tax=Streptomyces bauhiniae TaxID=2340725 RepID=UPI0035E27ED3